MRLNKVVRALMDRSEAATDAQGSDYGLFQTTVMLQKQVRLRTEEVEAAQRDNERVTGSLRVSASRDMQTLRRTAALQIRLLELVVQQKDVGELIDTVAILLDIPIVLFDARGRVLHRSRSAIASPDPARRLWAAYAGAQRLAAPPDMVEDAGERFYFRDILVMKRVERVLAAVASRRQPAEFAGASLSFLQQLVTLDVLHHREELTTRRRLRRRLLRDVLAADGAPDELAGRLQEQGLDGASVWRVTVVELKAHPDSRVLDPGAHGGERRIGRLLRAIDAALDERRTPFLSMTMGSMAVVLSAYPDSTGAAAHSVLADLQEAATRAIDPEHVVLGCSAPMGDVVSAPRSLRQAHAACMAAHREPASGDAVVFDELSGSYRLLDGLDEEALADIVQRTFAPILAYDAQHRAGLYETLHTLFVHHLAVQETADALHIHRNTLQKRLAHVEKLLGIDLREVDDVVDLRLGMHAADLLSRPSA